MSSITETKTEEKKEERKKERRGPVFLRPIEYFLGSDTFKQGVYSYVNVKVKGEKIEKTNSKLSPKEKDNFDIALDSLKKRLEKITNFEMIFIVSNKIFAREKGIDSVSLSTFPSKLVDKFHPLYEVSENIKVFIRKDLVGLNDDYSIHLIFSKDGETILLISL